LIDLTFPSLLSALGALVGIAGTILNISTNATPQASGVRPLWVMSDIALLCFGAIFTSQLWLGTMYTVYLLRSTYGIEQTPIRVLRKANDLISVIANINLAGTPKKLGQTALLDAFYPSHLKKLPYKLVASTWVYKVPRRYFFLYPRLIPHNVKPYM
jgi:hypothetical protein